MISQPYVSIKFAVNETSHIGEIRRYAASVANELGFDDTESGRLGIIVNELASNLIKHAKNGDLIFRKLHHHKHVGIEILSLDKGPGMINISRCMEDGYSTAGSPGTGLGAIARLSTIFDIYSQDKKGTAILAQVFKKNDNTNPLPTFGAICIPIAGETLCGDGWAIQDDGDQFHIVVSDGIGHGEIAAISTQAAIEHFHSAPKQSPDETLKTMHLALRSTRGAAIALILIEVKKALLHFTGAGNIAGMIVSNDKSRGLLSHNGIVGLQIHKIQDLQYPWSDATLLILHSDGLQTRWKLDDYPGLQHSHPSLITGILYRDYQRGRDDVTVLVVKKAA